MNKECRHCKAEKPLMSFHKHKQMPDGHINVCRDCRSTYVYGWRTENREIVKTKKSAYYQKNKEQINEKKKQDRKTNKSKYKEHNLMYFFGMTLAEYDMLFEQQNGICAICKNPETSCHQSGKIKDLAVDHDHKSGKIRGLLCSSCNMGLGKFKENAEYLRGAIAYIALHGENL